MSRISRITARMLVVIVLAGGIAYAQNGSDILQNRLKTTLNGMVQDVHDAPTPEEKRAVLERFLMKVERGAGVLNTVPFPAGEKRAALAVLQTRFEGYTATLRGFPAADEAPGGANPDAVAESDLDAFASFMQHDLEQAAQGVYLSTGAIIIVLLILLIIL